MKRISKILWAAFFITSICQLHAADIYVATTGNNTTGTGSISSPYQTIQKAATVAVAGDTIYIRAGVYRETITPVNSGTAGSRITYCNYPGETVTVSGADLISPGSWTLDSGNIYKAPLAASYFTSAFNQTLQVFVDGEMVTLAKWPNTTTRANAYPTGVIPAVDISHPAKSTTTSFVSKTRDTTANLTTGVVADTALPPQPAGFYDGAEISFQPNNGGWSWALSGVVSSVPANGNQITFTSRSNSGQDFNQSVYHPASRYYLFNKKEFLDSPGEWWHDTANGQLYLWTPTSAAPSTRTIEVKKRDFAFNLTNRSYITIQGLTIVAASITTDSGSGGNATGYNPDGSDNYPWRGAGYLAPSTGILLDGITARYLNHFTDISGHFFMQWGTSTGLVLSGTGHTLRNSLIERTAGNGVLLQGVGNTVFNNTFNDLSYAGVDTAAINTVTAENGSFPNGRSTDHDIGYNTIRRVGRSGITPRTMGNSNAAGGQFEARIYHNDIANFGLQDWDVGGLYGAVGDMRFTRINHNVVSEGVGFISAGLYLDYTKNAIIDHNVVWNVEWGIKLQGQSGGLNNTLVYNNTASVINTSASPFGPFGIGNSSGTNVGTVLRNNILSVITPPSAPGYNAISPANFTSAETVNNLLWDGVANSSTDPKFVARSTALNATNVNYQLQAGSAAIDTGDVIGTYIRDGVSIPPFADTVSGSAPDRGAYEYGVPAWSAGANYSQNFPPEFSPAPGNYSSAQNITLSASNAGATIHYTTDGSTPSSSSGILYTSPFILSTNATIRAIATGAGLSDSAVILGSFTINILPPPVPLVRWPFDGNLTADPTTYDGTASGTIAYAYASGNVGTQSLSLDDTNYVTTPNVINPTGNFTVTAWVRPTVTSSNSQTILQQADGSGTGRGWLYRKSDGRIGCFLGGAETASTGTVPIDTWTHVALANNGGTLQLYINGVADGSAYRTIESCVGTMFIGAHKVQTNQNWNGQIDELRLYNSVLNATQIAAIASNLSALAIFRSTHGIATDGSDDSLTPASDGVENLLKYAFNMLGSDPGQVPSLNTPNAAILTPNGFAGLPLATMGKGSDAGKLQITFIRRRADASPGSGITYTVEFSNDLGTTDPWAANPAATESTTSIDSIFERVTVTDSSVPARNFARVSVTAP